MSFLFVFITPSVITRIWHLQLCNILMFVLKKHFLLNQYYFIKKYFKGLNHLNNRLQHIYIYLYTYLEYCNVLHAIADGLMLQHKQFLMLSDPIYKVRRVSICQALSQEYCSACIVHYWI